MAEYPFIRILYGNVTLPPIEGFEKHNQVDAIHSFYGLVQSNPYQTNQTLINH